MVEGQVRVLGNPLKVAGSIPAPPANTMREEEDHA